MYSVLNRSDTVILHMYMYVASVSQNFLFSGGGLGTRELGSLACSNGSDERRRHGLMGFSRYSDTLVYASFKTQNGKTESTDIMAAMMIRHLSGKWPIRPYRIDSISTSANAKSVQNTCTSHQLLDQDATH